eukprot:6209323-Pleurochrysis_carterae.AAC.1
MLLDRAIRHAATLPPSVLPKRATTPVATQPAQCPSRAAKGVRRALRACAEPCCALAASVLSDSALLG